MSTAVHQLPGISSPDLAEQLEALIDHVDDFLVADLRRRSEAAVEDYDVFEAADKEADLALAGFLRVAEAVVPELERLDVDTTDIIAIGNGLSARREFRYVDGAPSPQAAMAAWHGGVKLRLQQLAYRVRAGVIRSADAEKLKIVEAAMIAAERRAVDLQMRLEAQWYKARAEASGVPESQPTTKRKLTLEDADTKASRLIQRDPTFAEKSQREWMEAIGCAKGQVGNLPQWQRLHPKSEKGRSAKPKIVRLTPEVGAMLGDPDGVLTNMVNGESDASPTIATPRKVRRRGR